MRSRQQGSFRGRDVHESTHPFSRDDCEPPHPPSPRPDQDLPPAPPSSAPRRYKVLCPFYTGASSHPPAVFALFSLLELEQLSHHSAPRQGNGNSIRGPPSPSSPPRTLGWARLTRPRGGRGAQGWQLHALGPAGKPGKPGKPGCLEVEGRL